MANSNDNDPPRGPPVTHFAAADSDGNFTLASSPSNGKRTKIVHISNLGDYLQGVKTDNSRIVVEKACKLRGNVPKPQEQDADFQNFVHANQKPHCNPTKMGNVDAASVWDLKENIAEVLLHLKKLNLPNVGVCEIGEENGNEGPALNPLSGGDKATTELGTPLQGSAREVQENVKDGGAALGEAKGPECVEEGSRAKNFTVLRRGTAATTTVKGGASGTPAAANVAQENVAASSCRSTSRKERKLGPRRRALVVGCCYLGDSEAALRGSCNDAFVMATLLVSHLGFDPQDVVLLIDSEPAQVYKDQLAELAKLPRWSRCSEPAPKPRASGFLKDVLNVFGNTSNGSQDAEANLFDLPKTLALDSPAPAIGGEANMPTRANILRGLRWLTQNTRPGDCGVFYFSGHGIQLDDLSGWEGEGYDEGLVPCDYLDHGGDPSRAIIPALQVKRMIQSVDKCCQMTLIVDAVGLQTMLDPAGCIGPWRFIRGSVTRGIWPIADATGKVKGANYNQSVFKSPKMQSQLVRPKYLPSIQIDCLANLLDGIFANAPVTASVNAVCVAAAPWQDVAIEALFKPLPLGGVAYSARRGDLSSQSAGATPSCESVVVHGCFTYCLATTLLCDFSAKGGPFLTLKELENGIVERCASLKRARLSLLQQTAQVTIHPSNLAGICDYFAHIWGGKVPVAVKGDANVFKSLEAGPGAFLKLSDAWMQVHQQGRTIAQEQRLHFGRMRSAALGTSNRLYTVDLYNNSWGPGSVAGSTSVTAGHAARRGTSVPRQATCTGASIHGASGYRRGRFKTGAVGGFSVGASTSVYSSGHSSGHSSAHPSGYASGYGYVGGNGYGYGPGYGGVGVCRPGSDAGYYPMASALHNGQGGPGTRVKQDVAFTFQNFAPPLCHVYQPFQHVPSGWNVQSHQAAPPPLGGCVQPQAAAQPLGWQSHQAAPPPLRGCVQSQAAAQPLGWQSQAAAPLPPLQPFVEYVPVPRRQATCANTSTREHLQAQANHKRHQQDGYNPSGAPCQDYPYKTMPRSNTSKCTQGVHLVEPITAALLSQLPARRF